MINFSEKFLVDANGKQIAVLLDIADYQKILEELEELEAIRAYDEAKAAPDETISFSDAIAEIEQNR
jgi:hypothetical protein